MQRSSVPSASPATLASENETDRLPSPKKSNRFSGIINGSVFLLVIIVSLLVYFTPLRVWLEEGSLIRERLTDFGPAAPAVFVLGFTVLTVIGVPRLLLCSLSGLVFGATWGLLWSQIGSLLGAYATFLFVRWGGRSFALHRFPRLAGLSEKIERNGMISVLLIRQLPMSGFYNNILLGLTAITHRSFLLGSLLGFLPLGMASSLIGAGLMQPDFAKSAQYIALALASSILLAWLLKSVLPSPSPQVVSYETEST